MSLNSLDDLFKAGAPSFFTKESPYGATITGPIIEATSIQSSDFVTGALETWDDGRPKMLLVVTVASNIRTTPDDNGHRSIYVKTWGEQSKALKLAFQNALGATATASQALTPGNIFTATYTHEIPSKSGSPTKMFTYQIQPVNAGLDQAFAQPAPAQQAPQQSAQPVQQFQQGPPPAWAQPAPAAAPPAAQTIPQAPVAQTIPQAPAPAQQPPQPAAAPAAPAAPVADPAGTARQLIALGLPDDQITAATGLDPAVITALRAQ